MEWVLGGGVAFYVGGSNPKAGPKGVLFMHLRYLMAALFRSGDLILMLILRGLALAMVRCSVNKVGALWVPVCTQWRRRLCGFQVIDKSSVLLKITEGVNYAKCIFFLVNQV